MSYSVINVCVGNIVSFSVGTAITWASPEIAKINATLDYKLTQDQGSWITSLFHLGAVFGPFLFGFLADKIGRKLTLVGTGIPIALAFVLMAFIKNLYVYYISRFITGISTGGLFTVMPMYIGEIADSSNRGLLAGLLNVFLCVGMLFSFCLGPYVNPLTFNLILAIFPIVFIPSFYFIAVETPTYLLNNKKPLKAREVLQKIRGPSANIDEEIQSVEKAIEAEERGGILDLFRTSGNIKAFSIVVGLLAVQQFSGINAVLSYSTDIFKQATSSIPAEVGSMIVGVVQLISSLMSSVLIDKLGRKMLLYVSAIGMVISELPLGIYSYLKDEENKDLDSISILPVICLIVYILTYNVGMGTLPWTIMGELYPSNVKSIGSALTSSLCWVMGFLIVKYFQTVQDHIGAGPVFWIFSLCCAVSLVFIRFVVIETKGKTLEEIQTILNK